MAASKKLRSFVHVSNPETGQSEVFGPDSDVPAWASKVIGDHCYEGGETPFEQQDRERRQAAEKVNAAPEQP